jgi:phospholipid/cholesterol/gamma-HCH transport system ATP-binding protein
VSLSLYFTRAFGAMAVGDIVPATVKTFFFGLVIGLVGCYKGYYSSKGTAGVGADEEELILASLKSVGLEEAIDLMPAELSGGMKRRVALARTLILKPKIILYDKPTTGLDPITANEIIQLMLKLQDELGTASIIITHDMDCARVISNRVIILSDGINYAEGTYQELDESKDSKVSAFFKDINKRNHG